MRRNLFRKNHLGLGVDELPDEPGRTNAINLRARARDTGSPAIIPRHNLWKRSLGGLRLLQFAQKHFHILRAWTVEKIDLPDLAKRFSDAIEFIDKCRCGLRFEAVTQPAKQLAKYRV